METSETKESGGSEKEIPAPAKDERMAVAEESVQPLVENPVAEQSAEDGHLNDISVPVEASAEPQVEEQTPKPDEERPKDTILPRESKNLSEDPASVNLIESVAEKKGNESLPCDAPLLENAGGVVADVKMVSSAEEKPLEDTLKQEEKAAVEFTPGVEVSNQSYTFEPDFLDGDDSGTEDDQAAFMKVLENFHKERSLEFKPPKFYGEGLNCLKLWRQVTRLGGYDRVTSCKLWRQVGESFRPPKTCTTVSWSFRIFYEKALLEYEKHKICTGELQIPISSIAEPMSADHEGVGNQPLGSGRARRDAAARAMQGWHSQRLLGNGEVGEPIIKDKSSMSLQKRDKHLKSIGVLKRKKASSLDRSAKVARTKPVSPHMDVMVVDVGAPADWVKINVRRTKDCFEVYALVPGLLREEVHVQSDPAGRLVISGEPEQPDNPWGVTPFKKVITLPSRIDPHQTSAVVTLHGQLFVRAPFEQSDL